MRYFARRYRCITFSFRGYHPSDVPADPASYGYEQFRDDVIAVLDHLKIDKAHICGLSMGGYATLCVGIDVSAARAVADARRHRLGLGTLAARGFPQGRRGDREGIRHARLGRRREDLRHGPGARAVRGEGPARLPGILRPVREPRRRRAPPTRCAAIRSTGRRSTTSRRTIKKIALPTLIICGDEDDPCIEPSIYLKKHIATSGLAMFPKSGHTVNIEEPALFNQTLGGFSRTGRRGAMGRARQALDPGGEEVAALLSPLPQA